MKFLELFFKYILKLLYGPNINYRLYTKFWRLLTTGQKKKQWICIVWWLDIIALIDRNIIEEKCNSWMVLKIYVFL